MVGGSIESDRATGPATAAESLAGGMSATAPSLAPPSQPLDATSPINISRIIT
jgi:hypothetical protein